MRVTLRLQAAADDVRGAGALFARPGRSSSGYSYVPDYEVTFDVAPRNMTASGLSAVRFAVEPARPHQCDATFHKTSEASLS